MNAETGKDNGPNTFEISGFPDIKFNNGDILLPDGHLVSDALANHVTQIQSDDAKEMLKTGLKAVGYSRIQVLCAMRKLLKISRKAGPVNDRELFRPANPETEKIVYPFLGKAVTPDSQLIGVDNLVEFMKMNKRGEKCAIYSTHGSEMEPPILRMLANRLWNDDDIDKDIADAAGDLDRTLTAVIGHKVWGSRFNSTFAGALKRACTVSPKYSRQLQNDKKANVTMYTKNGTILTDHLQSNPLHTVMIFPQGGMTRISHESGKYRIAFLKIMGPSARGVNILPTFIDAPDGFLRPDLGENMYHGKANVNVYFGQPFKPEEKNIVNLVQEFRSRLLDVDAPIESRNGKGFEFGYMNSKKDKPDEFVEV